MVSPSMKIKTYEYYRLFHAVNQKFWSKQPLARAVVHHQCPECGAPHGRYCRTEHNQKIWPPHKVRQEMEKA